MTNRPVDPRLIRIANLVPILMHGRRTSIEAVPPRRAQVIRDEIARP